MIDRMDEQLEPGADPVATAPEATAPEATASDGPVLAAPPSEAEALAPGTGSTGPIRSRRAVTRFLLAFTFGLLAVLTISAGALAAYESANTGRILPGVHVGSVDLSGLTPAAAGARLRDAFKSLEDGALVLSGAGMERSVEYADLGRRVDYDAIVARALEVGRSGPVLERIASNVRIYARGAEVGPIVTLEGAAVRFEIAALATAIDLMPSDASVSVGETGFVLTPGIDGRRVDIEATLAAAMTLLADPDAPRLVRVDLPITIVEPGVTSDEAAAARAAADRIAVDVDLLDGAETRTISGTEFRGWISFAAMAGGGYGPVVAQEGLESALNLIADDVAVAPVDATFLFADNEEVVGVTDAKNGRALDVPATVASLAKLIEQRVAGLSVSRILISTITVEPELTTAQATQTAPLMKPISEWTTYFPIGIKNGDGANIWIPAREIDGQVVLPGQWFDFWNAIGPVTRENGYKDGGAIINGKTEPQGALAGGICSTSTTLFNAALRAGLEMGARRNHYYYIDRYPLGLDATVFQSSSGSVQTMSFRNDTENPILIRGTGWKVGSKGYVKFVLWSVPTGRGVDFSTPIVKNIRPATDTTVYTTELPPGVKERIEYPVEGKDVWVTRTVTDSAGTVIHQETYYSHYARITGILQIGVAPEPTPVATPPPA
jgi:vancomycin resistance protein YoaR